MPTTLKPLIVLVVVVLVLVACAAPDPSTAVGTAVAATLAAAVSPTGTPTPLPSVTPDLPCLAKEPEFFERSDPLYQRWKDALELTSRANIFTIGQQAADLQAIHREYEALRPSHQCAVAAWARLDSHMELVIDAVLDFMAQEPTGTPSHKIKEAGTKAAEYKDELQTVTAEAIQATRGADK